MSPQTAIDAVFAHQGVDGVIDPDGEATAVRLLIDGAPEEAFAAERPVNPDSWRIKVREADVTRIKGQVVVFNGIRRIVIGEPEYEDRLRLVALFRTAAVR